MTNVDLIKTELPTNSTIDSLQGLLSKYHKPELWLKSRKLFLDRVSTRTGSDLVVISMRSYTFLTPMVHQVATAPCTDPIQVRFLLLRQAISRARTGLRQSVLL